MFTNYWEFMIPTLQHHRLKSGIIDPPLRCYFPHDIGCESTRLEGMQITTLESNMAFFVIKLISDLEFQYS